MATDQQIRVGPAVKALAAAGRRAPRPGKRPLRLTRRGRLVFGALGLGLVGALGLGLATLVGAGSRAARVELAVDGLADGGVVDAARAGALVVRARVEPASRREDARVRLDGADVTGRAEPAPDGLAVPAGGLAEGEHRVELSVPRRFPFGDTTTSFAFRVDATPPPLALDPPAGPVPLRQPYAVTGTAEPGAKVEATGAAVEVGADGRFTARYERPPEGATVVVTDAAGNAASAPVTAPVARPDVRAVHTTAKSWAHEGLRAAVLALVDEGRIDAVELDIKDEAGVVGYASAVPLANEIGAVQPTYDLAATVAELHARGVHVIGRVVVFADPILARAAWAAGRRDDVVQTPRGGRYAGYGGFTNLASAAVRRYNVDLAVEAARAGVDDILYDYVRRPDGVASTMVFPGLQGTPEDAIVGFMAESRAALRAEGAYLGASVFGIAATRPEQTAQDVPRMARHADYIAPMVYPSHWGRGEYGVANPNAQPFDITLASVRDFARVTEGTGAKVVPWLQDFSLGGIAYGPAQVRAQIDAAAQAGSPSFLLWDPNVTYTAAALDPRPR